MAAVARYLGDTSALARLGDPVVATILGPLVEAGLVATCAVVELEVRRSARTAVEYAELALDRGVGYEMLVMDDRVWARTLDVLAMLAEQGAHRSVPLPDLLIAACAERHGVTVLHYDADYDRISAFTGQPVEWVVPRGTVP